ncbi:D(2) dopamine receptor [Patella vulgata]|uniref:D(2) dopamine receptor n=1 Tax=Patella vulgata TaxID=6465 RepID=UPI00217F5E15|nr:D(2) dopamine receptor [Patella vulgata]
MVVRADTNCTLATFCHVSDDSKFFTSSVSISSQIFAISTLIFTCLLGNCLLCFAVFKSPARRSAASILLLNLAVADFLVGVLVLPMWILPTALLGWPLSDNMCEFVACTTTVLMLCSVFSLCGISVDRYCNIAMPLRYPIEVTLERITLIVVGVWIYCILVASCPLFGWGDYRFQPQTVPICNPVWVTEISFAVFLVLSGMAVPVALMLFSYIKIVLIARDHIRRIDAIHRPTELPINENNNKVKDELPVSQPKFSKSLKMVQRVFIAVGVFFMCWGPYVILNFWSVNHEEVPVPYIADLLVTLLAFANSSINPVIFIILNKDFRHSIRNLKTQIQSKCLCFQNRVIALDNNNSSNQDDHVLKDNQRQVDRVDPVLNNGEKKYEKTVLPFMQPTPSYVNGTTEEKQPDLMRMSRPSTDDFLKKLVVSPLERSNSKIISRTKSFRKLPGVTDSSVPKSKFGIKRGEHLRKPGFKTLINAYSVFSLSELKKRDTLKRLNNSRQVLGIDTDSSDRGSIRTLGMNSRTSSENQTRSEILTYDHVVIDDL